MNIDLPDPIPTMALPDLRQPLEQASLVSTVAGEFHLARFLLTDGPRAGVELLVVECGAVRAAICPTRGMGLWKANISGLPCGWISPVEGPIHPSCVPVSEPSGIGWLEGFDELLVRCGLRSCGAPDFSPSGQLLFPLHGRIANLPARNLQIRFDEQSKALVVSGEVHEARCLQHNLRLVASYHFRIGEPSVRVHDVVWNAGDTPTPMQLLYHINIGPPLLSAGAKLHTAADVLVARDAHAAQHAATWQEYEAATPGFAEQVYFSEAKPNADGWATNLLVSPDQQAGVAVRFRTVNLPYFIQWKNTVGEADGYVTGLEPATAFPNPHSFEMQHGRVPTLQPGESKEFDVQLEVLNSEERIEQEISHLDALRGGQPPQIEAYRDRWCIPRD